VLLDKAAIRSLIPHSGSMCLLDQVVAWDDVSIFCTSETHRAAANPLRRGGRLSALHAFEYGAQAAAVHGGLRAGAAGEKTPPCYLVALRDAHLHVARLDDIESPLEVRAQRLFGDAGNTVYEFEISANQMLLADARITIMVQPSFSGGTSSVSSQP
jgi:predicted hotdog family 3-hydroxylacyl-ACP dehydratase